MTSGWIFLGIVTLICIGSFLNGVRFARMTKNPWVRKSLFGMPIEGSEISVRQLRRFGKIQMLFAPVFLLVVAAMCFGFLGPVEGIKTIKL